MKVLRHIASVSAAGLVTMALGGAALADSTVTTTDTGSHSNQQTTITTTNDVHSSNTNNISVTNVTSQQSSTGNVSSHDNTTAGTASSGNASNVATNDTTVTIGNQPAGGMGNGGGNTGGSGNGSGGSGGSGNGSTGGSGGSVLGASTVGGLGGGSSVATLPEVGASVPMDVSALRALYNPNAQTPTTNLVKNTQGISALFLAVAAALSLLGAVGSAVYAQRKENRV